MGNLTSQCVVLELTRFSLEFAPEMGRERPSFQAFIGSQRTFVNI
jgi:hypothetical protein